jgi:hypothetical protein
MEIATENGKQVCRNDRYGFETECPAHLGIFPAVYEKGEVWPWGHLKSALKFDLEVEDKATRETNFGGAEATIGVYDAESAADCKDGSPETINEITFYRGNESDLGCGAGSCFSTTYYRTPRSNYCYAVNIYITRGNFVATRDFDATNLGNLPAVKELLYSFRFL